MLLNSYHRSSWPASPQSPGPGRRWQLAAVWDWTPAPCSSPAGSSQAPRPVADLWREDSDCAFFCENNPICNFQLKSILWFLVWEEAIPCDIFWNIILHWLEALHCCAVIEWYHWKSNIMSHLMYLADECTWYGTWQDQTLVCVMHYAVSLKSLDFDRLVIDNIELIPSKQYCDVFRR